MKTSLEHLPEQKQQELKRAVEIIKKYSEKKDAFSVSSIAGIAEDEEVYGRDHDKWLYKKK